jgi:hypothetical protein
MGYLVCDQCGGYYRLHEGESPDDFMKKCQCGGHLEYFDNLGGNLGRSSNRVYEGKNTKERFFIPLMLIFISIECILAMFYTSGFIVILGVIGFISGLFLLLIRLTKLENSLKLKTLRIIYLFLLLLFLVETGFLVNLWFQMDNSGAKIGILIFVIIGILCSLSMIFKALSPHSSQNFLDPP